MVLAVDQAYPQREHVQCGVVIGPGPGRGSLRLSPPPVAQLQLWPSRIAIDPPDEGCAPGAGAVKRPGHLVEGNTAVCAKAVEAGGGDGTEKMAHGVEVGIRGIGGSEDPGEVWAGGAVENAREVGAAEIVEVAIGGGLAAGW